MDNLDRLCKRILSLARGVHLIVVVSDDKGPVFLSVLGSAKLEHLRKDVDTPEKPT